MNIKLHFTLHFPDPGERAAHEAGEEAPLCPVCDGPMECKYEWARRKFYCPECIAAKHFFRPADSCSRKSAGRESFNNNTHTS
jgi:hypothetical protein